MEEEDDLSLLDLPFMVLQKAAGMLDISSLKRLRLTCKYMKSVVDSPQVNRKFFIRMDTEKRIEEVTNSDTAWTNFHFVMFRYFTADQIRLLSDWAEKCGSAAKSVSITNTFSEAHVPILQIFPPGRSYAPNPIIKLLLHLDNVEYLEILEFDFTTVSDTNWPKILKNWSKIRHLHLLQIKYDLNDSSSQGFELVLAHVKGLQTLTMPRIHAKKYLMSSLPISYSMSKDRPYDAAVIAEYGKIVLAPVLNRVQNELKMAKKSSIQIIISTDELFTLDSYLPFVNLCHQASIVIFHLIPALVPSQILSVPKELAGVANTLGSVIGINETILSQEMSNMKQLEISRENFLFTTDGPYATPLFPKLDSLSLHLIDWPTPEEDLKGVERLSSFIACLSSAPRTTITSVHVSGYSARKMSKLLDRDSNIMRPTFLLSFVNIAFLDLRFVEYTGEEYASLWATLKKLKRIILWECPGCNDTAIIGRGEAKIGSMLSLPDLTYLTLRGVNITTASFRQVISKLKLIIFRHTSATDETADDEAVASLIRGNLWNYLELLQLENFSVLNYQEKEELRLKFEDYPDLAEPMDEQEDTNSTDAESSTTDGYRRGCICF